MNVALMLFHLFSGHPAAIQPGATFRDGWNDDGCELWLSSPAPTTPQALQTFGQHPRIEARCNLNF